MLFASLTLVAAMSNVPAPAQCALRVENGQWKGSCGRLFDQVPVMTLARAKALTTGIWRKDVHPESVWSGEMTDADYGKAPLELEVYRGGTGVLRTIYGWFPVTAFSFRARSLRFRVDAENEVRPNELDREIVRRAEAILSSPAVWNRADDRKCPNGATSWSIYCAMEQATIDVTGAPSHRRPAMEFVRRIVDERSAGREYHHRLMDYNNDPATSFRDVQSLFAEALSRMSR